VSRARSVSFAVFALGARGTFACRWRTGFVRTFVTHISCLKTLAVTGGHEIVLPTGRRADRRHLGAAGRAAGG